MNLDYVLSGVARSAIVNSAFLKELTIFFADYLGYFLIGFLAILFLFRFKKYFFVALQGAVAVVLSRGIITEIIRFFWHRSRPLLEGTGSFPSGHATFYFALAAVLYFYNRKLGILAFVITSVMGIARVFAGYHWPSDILGGAVIGIASGVVVVKLFQKFYVQKT